jgi:molybdopterin-guanine dinucleotide biosynthesis protein A
MGHDKALISINDKPAYLHFAHMLGELCESVYVSCKNTQGLSFDGEEQISPLYDEPAFSDRGPLTGILSWLNQWSLGEQAPKSANNGSFGSPHAQASPFKANVQGLLVVGCDYRNLDLETLSGVLAVGQTQDRICCYQNHLNGIIDPLVAYYPMTDLQELFDTRDQQSSLRLFVETRNACILPTNPQLLQVLKSFDR